MYTYASTKKSRVDGWGVFRDSCGLIHAAWFAELGSELVRQISKAWVSVALFQLKRL